jgi:hypothetical protein
MVRTCFLVLGLCGLLDKLGAIIRELFQQCSAFKKLNWQYCYLLCEAVDLLKIANSDQSTMTIGKNIDHTKSALSILYKMTKTKIF